MSKESPDKTAIPANPEKLPVYASTMMANRRQRLRKETRKLINERGLSGFSVREVCRRAEVAPRTLYNAFQNKNRLIGLAIRESYEKIQSQLAYSTDANTVTGIIHRTISLNRGNLSARNYVEALVHIYFDPETPEDLWDMLQSMSVRRVARWLGSQQNKGLVEPWAIPQSVAARMADAQWGTIRSWVAGRLTDEEYIYQVVEATLLSLVAVLQGPPRAEAVAFLETMHLTGQVPDFPNATVRISIGSDAHNIQNPP